MSTGLTELVFILDKSGSMAGLEADTIGGFNSMLEKQKMEDGKCKITTVFFNHRVQLIHDRIDIKEVNPVTAKEYSVGGYTALIDAIGETVKKMEDVQKSTVKEYRADKVLFVIITDGHENSSREYRVEDVKEKIEHHKEKDGWEFVFLGANMDAIVAASRFGIGADRTYEYLSDRKGTELNYQVVSDSVSEYRRSKASSPKLSEEHFKRIKDDVKKRKNLN